MEGFETLTPPRSTPPKKATSPADKPPGQRARPTGTDGGHGKTTGAGAGEEITQQVKSKDQVGQYIHRYLLPTLVPVLPAKVDKRYQGNVAKVGGFDGYPSFGEELWYLCR